MERAVLLRFNQQMERIRLCCLHRSTVTSSDCVHSLTRVRLQIGSFRFFYEVVSLEKGTEAVDSYVLLTICSLSPFLNVRSDAVRDS